MSYINYLYYLIICVASEFQSASTFPGDRSRPAWAHDATCTRSSNFTRKNPTSARV